MARWHSFRLRHWLSSQVAWPRSSAMKRILLLCGLLAFLGIASPVAAQDLGQQVLGPSAAPCYWCTRDSIYDDVKLINHLEANPDIDEGVKGTEIVAARADIHR